MATSDSSCWTIVASDDSAEQPSVQDLKTSLEKGNDAVKIDAMKRLLSLMMSGDLLPQLTMHVIRFVLPSKNKALKKLLLFYWELVPKKSQDGKLRQEMILVWYASLACEWE
jgi:coatomer subunit beta